MPATSFTLVSCSAYSSTLKMTAICSSEMSVDFQRTKRRSSSVLNTVSIKTLTFLFCNQSSAISDETPKHEDQKYDKDDTVMETKNTVLGGEYHLPRDKAQWRALGNTEICRLFHSTLRIPRPRDGLQASQYGFCNVYLVIG
jgi:hypothetical protein